MKIHAKISYFLALPALALVMLLPLTGCLFPDDGSGGAVEGDPWNDADHIDCEGKNYTWSHLKGTWNYLASGGVSGWITMTKYGQITSWTDPSCEAWGSNKRDADLDVIVTCAGLVKMTGTSTCAADPGAAVRRTVFKLKFDHDDARKLTGIYYFDYAGKAKAIYLYRTN